MIEKVVPNPLGKLEELRRKHPCASPSDYDPFDNMARAELDAETSYLQAVVDTTVPHQPFSLEPNDVNMARHLIDFDVKNVCSFTAFDQRRWKATLSLEGGRILAHWIPVARKQGLITDGQTRQLTEVARGALATAWDLFSRLEEGELEGRPKDLVTQPPSPGPMLTPSSWEPYLIEAQQELLALPHPGN